MAAHRDGVSHWDEVYAGGDASRSWFQACPRMSLTMLDAAGVTASDSLIDVGGGASRLAGALLGRGFRDITVLDISVTGMRYAQDHLGEQAQQVQWLAADVLAWEPPRRFRVWHDRAVFHFLTNPPGQHRYVRVLDAALIDIRGDDQRREDGLIPGAIVVPRNSLEWRCDPACAWRHPAITRRDLRIILVCDQGYQSSLAAANLQQLGLIHATDLDGGFTAWAAAGLPLITPGDSQPQPGRRLLP